MKSCYRNILLASAVILAAASCTKTHTEEIPDGPMPISICATDGTATKTLLEKGTNNATNEPATKAMLDATTFQTEGNRLQIYDFVDNGTTPHINDQIGPDVEGSPLAQATAGVWPFENGPHQWTPGMHRFFGWLALDANGTKDDTSDDLTPEAFFGTGFSFNQATKTLTIPQKTMSADTPQFDFMYSNIFATEPINEPVQLEFSHLFCAISFGLQNATENPVVINKLSITNIYTTRAATIDFSSDQPIVTYSNSVPAQYGSTIANKTIAEDITWTNIFTQGTTEAAKTYVLMWPHEASEISMTNPEDYKIDIDYTIKYPTGDKNNAMKVNFPNTAWEAGKKYHFVLNLAPIQTVTIKYIVTDWDNRTVDVPSFN